MKYGRRKTDVEGAVKEPSQRTLSLSETDFMRLFESAKYGILLIDPETGEITFANQTFFDMSGYSQSEVVGKKLWEARPFSAIDVGRIVFRELQGQDSIYYDDLPFETKGGSHFSMELICGIHTVGGKRVIQCNIRNVTERRWREEELWRAESRFRELFEHAAIGMAIEDLQERIVENNRRLEKMLGYAERELEGGRFSDITHPADLLTDADLFRELVQGKRGSYSMEKRFVRKDGRPMWGLLNVSLLRDPGTRPQFVVRTVEDTTLRHEMEESLRSTAWQYRILFESNPEPMWIYDKDALTFLDVNDAAVLTYGYSREELLRMTIQHLHASEEFFDFLKTAHTVRTPYLKPDAWKLRKKNGDVIDAEIAVHQIRFNNAEARFVVAVDITARKKAEELLKETRQLLHDVLNALPIGVWITDNKGNIIMGNPAGKQIWGGERYVGVDRYGEYKSWWKDSGKRIGAGEWALARAVTKGETSLDEVIGIEGFDGVNKTILNSAVPLRDADGNIKGAIVINQDITERRRNEEELKRVHTLLERQATTDSLTGIYNRLKFNEMLDREIQEALRYNNPLSLIMFDIDHFKAINDTYGHLAGDVVLREVSRVISDNIRNVDIFARWGGEEFIVLSPNNEWKSAWQLAEKLRAQIEKFDFSCPCTVTCSYGVTQFQENDTVDSLIKRVDYALYQAKERGRNRVETA